MIVDVFDAGNYSTFFRGSLHRTECSMCGKCPSDYIVLFCVGGLHSHINDRPCVHELEVNVRSLI